MTTIITLISFFYAAEGMAVRISDNGLSLFVNLTADSMPEREFYAQLESAVTNRDGGRRIEDLISHFRGLLLSLSTRSEAQRNQITNAIYNSPIGLDHDWLRAWNNFDGNTHKYDLAPAIDEMIELATTAAARTNQGQGDDRQATQ